MHRWFTCALLSVWLLIGCASPNAPRIVETELVLISQTSTNGWAQDVWLYGDTAFVAEDEQGVTIWDITDLSDPRLIDTLRTSARVNMVEYAPVNDIVFVVEDVNNAGVAGYPLSTRRRDFNIGSTGVFDFRIVHDVQDTFIVVYTDVSDRYVRFVVEANDAAHGWGESRSGTFGAFAAFRGFDIRDELIYLAHGQLGLQMVRVDYTSATITPLGSVDTPGSARDASLNEDGTHVVVADFQSGIQIIDVTNPDSLRIVGSFLPDRGDRVFKVEVVGDRAYFLDEHNGLYVADITEPDSPRLIAYYQASEPTGIVVRDDHTIFLTDEDLGLIILRWP